MTSHVFTHNKHQWRLGGEGRGWRRRSRRVVSPRHSFCKQRPRFIKAKKKKSATITLGDQNKHCDPQTEPGYRVETAQALAGKTKRPGGQCLFAPSNNLQPLHSPPLQDIRTITIAASRHQARAKHKIDVCDPLTQGGGGGDRAGVWWNGWDPSESCQHCLQMIHKSRESCVNPLLSPIPGETTMRTDNTATPLRLQEYVKLCWDWKESHCCRVCLGGLPLELTKQWHKGFSCGCFPRKNPVCSTCGREQSGELPLEWTTWRVQPLSALSADIRSGNQKMSPGSHRGCQITADNKASARLQRADRLQMRFMDIV